MNRNYPKLHYLFKIRALVASNACWETHAISILKSIKFCSRWTSFLFLTWCTSCVVYSCMLFSVLKSIKFCSRWSLFLILWWWTSCVVYVFRPFRHLLVGFSFYWEMLPFLEWCKWFDQLEAKFPFLVSSAWLFFKPLCESSDNCYDMDSPQKSDFWIISFSIGTWWSWSNAWYGIWTRSSFYTITNKFLYVNIT